MGCVSGREPLTLPRILSGKWWGWWQHAVEWRERGLAPSPAEPGAPYSRDGSQMPKAAPAVTRLCSFSTEVTGEGGEQPPRVQTPALRSWGVKGRRDLGKEMKKQCGVEGGLVQNIGEKLGDKFILTFVLKVP